MFSKESKTQEPTPAPAPEAPRTDRAAAPHGAPSIISADLRIHGNLSSNGDIQLDGTVEGDVSSRSLTVGEKAHVNGVITADSVTICGNVEGEIRARNVKLMRNGRVTGDIAHESLAVEGGASIEGNLRRLNSEQAAKPQTPKPVKTASGANVTDEAADAEAPRKVATG